MGSFKLLIVALFSLAAFSVVLAGSAAYAEIPQLVCKPGSTITVQEGRSTLNRTQQSYSTLKTLKAHFIQESYNVSLDISETSSGLMWFSKPGYMKWHYNEPHEQDFIVKDKTFWLYQVEERQVVIDNFSKILISDLPIAFIMGIGNLNSDFSVKSACQSKDSGAVLLELTPKDGDRGEKELKSFGLAVDKNTFLPLGSRVTDVAGNVTAMGFSSVEVNQPIPDELYKTDFPEGIDINDRRMER